MHDVRTIRDNPVLFDQALASRSLEPLAAKVLELDTNRRMQIKEFEEARAHQNVASRQLREIKAAKREEEFEQLRRDIAKSKSKIKELEQHADISSSNLHELLLSIPNLPDEDVPFGKDETENVEISRWGKIREFEFTPLEHYEIKAAQDGMDFITAAKLSGSRFCLLLGSMARLHRALAQFMIDVHVQQNGLTEVWTPVLVNTEIMVGTGQLPKLAEDSYRTEDGMWLIPTAEVSLTNIVREQIIDVNYLPRRFCAHSQCFRSEAGAAGRDTAGMLRQHQFEKVEMVSITLPEYSKSEHERMRRCAEDILERLEIPYRTVILCTGDLGFGAQKTYDVEVWLPGQGKYREISSVSNCGDFQARRMNARYRPKDGGSPKHVHTLNGSGLAVGRSLIAVLENGQNIDGSVSLPSALSHYVNGYNMIDKNGTFFRN